MEKGRVRKLFPGGNTPFGFYSFFDNIASLDAHKIFVVKGGPGVGKSTFMKKIGMELADRGFALEEFHCSSDPDSLDGIYFPQLDIAMIDGTAPHVVDPKVPGAVDEIINLGEFWDENGIRSHKREILARRQENGRLYARAYPHLKIAKIYMDELESYIAEANALDIVGLNRYTQNLAEELYSAVPQMNRVGKVRHLFASAITPDGPVNYFETLFDHLPRRVVITGKPGTGRTTMVKKLAEAAMLRGYDAEIFHCAMDPEKYEHFIIKDLGLAVISSVDPHTYQPKAGDVEVNTRQFVNEGALLPYQEEMELTKIYYNQAFMRAVSFIARTKKIHDDMETYYVPNMNFEGIEKKRHQIVSRILELAADKGF